MRLIEKWKSLWRNPDPEPIIETIDSEEPNALNNFVNQRIEEECAKETVPEVTESPEKKLVQENRDRILSILEKSVYIDAYLKSLDDAYCNFRGIVSRLSKDLQEGRAFKENLEILEYSKKILLETLADTTLLDIGLKGRANGTSIKTPQAKQ